ncbi:MAG: M48 family metalloprotease [Promethearchaeota archaeon]
MEEISSWAKINRRSELSDIVAILFFLFVILFFTKDLLTAFMGAFALYLWAGVLELKEYPVINKILAISLITYNIIFIAGLISFFTANPLFLNIIISFSFWIILLLGFFFFGRRYLIVFRFMSPSYLTLFLYFIAWLGVVFINQYTPLNFVDYLYIVLIGVNWLVYFLSGVILDKLLGIKRVKDENLIKLVENVKENLGLNKKVKVGHGKYPILNAIAYGPIFDNRIAIIAEDLNKVPSDELKGIVSHELAHVKGHHTLILTIIASIDLLIRMPFHIPATLYDYTFDNPTMPLIVFIAVNIGFYIIIYIFIRYLEGLADLTSKKAGYSKELAKALYTLESFYVEGKEIGINTMLLCDEKVSQENKLLDYLETAQYINNSMIKPSKISLISNVLNSHPPTFFRIAALLGKEFDAKVEAVLPFICLFNKIQSRYSLRFETARLAFKEIANKKFKGAFKVSNIPTLMIKFERKNQYRFDLGKTFVFKDKRNERIFLGKLLDVRFSDDVSDTDLLITENLNDGKIYNLNSSLYSKIPVSLNEKYPLGDKHLVILKKIEIDESKTKAYYIFENESKKIIRKSIKKFKLPNPISSLENLENKILFLKEKGTIQLIKCSKIKIDKAWNESRFELSQLDAKQNLKKISFQLKELIIRPKTIHFSLKKDKKNRDALLEILKWACREKIKISFFLKKPVNNIEKGYLNKVEIQPYDDNLERVVKMDYSRFNILVDNMFGNKIILSSELIESISFDHDTALLQKKSETSIFSKMAYKILKNLKPQEIWYFK